MTKKLVKQDQNLLEFPLWFIDKEKRKQGRFELQTETGKFLFGLPFLSLPDSIDAVILLGILKVSQSRRSKTIVLKRSDLMKLVGLPLTAHYYNRLWESLRKWKQTSIQFEGGWFDGNSRKMGSRLFGILAYAEYVEEEETGDKVKTTRRFKITLDEKFYELIGDSKYYRLIDLEQYRLLRKPTSRRLYEILLKHLENNNKWECEVKKLAEKLTLNEKYPSHIVRKLKPATADIRKNTTLKVSFHSRTTADNRTIATFRKLKDTVSPAKERELQQKANVCWNRIYGACGALWEDYRDHPERDCFHCKKFITQKDQQPELFPSD